MRQLAEGLWVHEAAMRMLGTELPLRTTVARLAEGGLWVHSPTALSPALQDELGKLGEVSCLVAASNGHNRWLRDWIAAFPGATVFASGGIVSKYGLEAYRLLDQQAVSPWPLDFKSRFIPGAPFFDETVFLHTSSASLIVTDLVQNYTGDTSTGLEALIRKWILQPVGFRDICLAPPIQRGWVVKDKDALLAALREIQRWDFERIVVCHGDIVEDSAKQVLAQLYSKLER